MRYIVTVLLLSMSVVNVYGADFKFDTDRAKEMLTNENARNPNRYNTSEMKGGLNNWLSNPGNLKAVSGEDGNTLKTLGGEDVSIDRECTVGQKKLAELSIDGGKPVSVSLNLSSGQSFQLNNILGVCENKMTVCNKKENIRICKEYAEFEYTDYKNTGEVVPCEKGGTCAERSMAISHVCYDVPECMSWHFALNNNSVAVKSAAGENCGELKSSGITVGQRDYIIHHIESILAGVSKHGLSQTATGADNKHVTYNELSYNDCSGDNYSKFGSGMTDLSLLKGYYNIANASSEYKDAFDDNSPIIKDSKNSDMVKSLENQKTLDSYDNLSSKFNDVSGGISSGFSTIDSAISAVPENFMEKIDKCLVPTCTIDVVYKKSVKSTTGGNIGEDHKSKQRIFRQCEPVALVQKGFSDSSGTMEFRCPIDSNRDDGVETVVRQSDGKECSCNNEHQQSANMQKVLVATKLAELINGKLCPKDEADNDNMSKSMDNRQKCTEQCQSVKTSPLKYRNCIENCTNRVTQ